MSIPSGAIAPLYIASFILLGFQYYRLNYDRRVMNLQFGMMLGAIVLLLASVSITAQLLS
jgi:uncharacterized membrane protein